MTAPPEAAALRPVLARLGTGAILDAVEAEAAFGIVMAGEASDAEIAALLMALRVRGETPGELVGAVRAIRARMLAVAAPPGAIDLCGTGGDGAATLNVSTAAAFVVAACGVPVAKHGNRAVSSRSGGSDVLACLGVDPDPPPEAQQALLDAHGLAFLFAPRHHAALRFAAPARRALGTRSLLNLAGPLCNPAGVRRQLTGVSDPAWLRPMAEALRALGTERAWLVHGGGLDEITLDGETRVCALGTDGTIVERIVAPEDAGIARAPRGSVAGGDPAHNARALAALLDGGPGPYRDIVLLNAAAALLLADRAADLRDGARQAASAIDDGRAAALLATLRRDATRRHS